MTRRSDCAQTGRPSRSGGGVDRPQSRRAQTRGVSGTATPLRIDIGADALDDLQRRLGGDRPARFALNEPELGIDVGVLDRVAANWRNDFDRRAGAAAA
jgi:hypothetical protein